MAAFWFHFNKPESRRRGRPIMTLHHKKKCHFVELIECNVPVWTRHRKTQPVVVMAGFCETVKFRDIGNGMIEAQLD